MKAKHCVAWLLWAMTGSELVLAEPVQLASEFSIDEVKWVKQAGDASVFGEAFIRLKDNSLKGCAGFGVELLPVAAYSNERILKSYGNNDRGQVLLEDNPPKFTPDVPAYHDLLLKSTCDGQNNFVFNNVPAGEYYVLAFIIWDRKAEQGGGKSGGAVMKRITVTPGSRNPVQLAP